MEWADASVWQAVPTVPAAAGDSTLRARLHHIHLVQRAFLQVWSDGPLDLPEVSDFTDLPALEEWAQPYYAEVGNYLEALDPPALERPVTMPWVPRYEQRLGRRFSTPTLAETIFQVTSHSTYHRGQVNARLRELGGEPPLVDFIAWVWLGKPAASWTTTAESYRP